jgi:hypothetical protein
VSLSDRFELFGLKRDEGARTFEAREIATGRPVLVHLLSLNSPLLKKLDALPEAERGRVIDRGQDEGGVYLVTDRLAEFAGLKEWLSQGDPAKPLGKGGAWQIKPPASVDSQLADLFDAPAPVPTPTMGPTPVLTNTAEITLQMPAVTETPSAPAPAPAAAPSLATAPAANEPGEFTRQFAPVLRPVPAPTAPPAAASAPVPPKPKEAGEFTRLFQNPMRPKAPAKAADPPPVAPTPPGELQPGEFTQMLQAQRPAAPPSTPSLSASQESEFARYFQSPMTPAPSTAPIAPPMPPKGNFQSGKAGEFTQVFGRADIPPPPVVQRPGPPPIAPVASPEATQVFERPRTLTPPPLFPAPVSASGSGPAMPAIPNVPNKVPGEYTRQFSAPAPLTFGQAPGAPQVSRMPVIPPPVKQKSRLPLFLLIGGGLLLVLALIVYFVLRPRV